MPGTVPRTSRRRQFFGRLQSFGAKAKFWNWDKDKTSVWVPAFLTIIIAIFGGYVTYSTNHATTQASRESMAQQVNANIRAQADNFVHTTQRESYTGFMQEFIVNEASFQYLANGLVTKWANTSEQDRQDAFKRFNDGAGPINKATLTLYVVGSPAMVQWVSKYSLLSRLRSTWIEMQDSANAGVQQADLPRVFQEMNDATIALNAREFLTIARTDLNLPLYDGPLAAFDPDPK